jgi:enoyl-CoA hydratase/carnithine racemase
MEVHRGNAERMVSYSRDDEKLEGGVSASADTGEGVSAFIEKRRAQWSDN